MFFSVNIYLNDIKVFSFGIIILQLVEPEMEHTWDAKTCKFIGVLPCPVCLGVSNLKYLSLYLCKSNANELINLCVCVFIPHLCTY